MVCWQRGEREKVFTKMIPVPQLIIHHMEMGTQNTAIELYRHLTKVKQEEEGLTDYYKRCFGRRTKSEFLNV
jgi:hypothetical protein